MSIPGMQIVSHRDLSGREARTLTERIKSKMGDLMLDVVKAHQGRAWMALGYESWPDYIKAEFGHAPLALPRDERRAVVALLRGQGMSARAIAPTIGVDRQTIANDLAGGEFSPPGDAVPVTGLDGKTYRDYSVTCTTPQTSTKEEMPPPAPPTTITCPTCGGAGRITQ